MNRKVTSLILIIVLFMGIGCITENEEPVNNETNNDEVEEGNVVVYWFYSDSCPYCAKQKEFLDELEREKENLDIRGFIPFEEKEQQLYIDLFEAHDQKPTGSVPATFIGDEYWIGYNEEMGQEMKDKIEECLEIGNCTDPRDL